MKSSVGNKDISFYLFFFLFGIYFFSASGNNINFSDQQQVRFEVTRSIIEEGVLTIPDGMGVKGNYSKDYSWYGIGQPLLAIPFYMIGRDIGGFRGAQETVSVLNQLVVAASGIVLFLFIMNLGYIKKTALIVTVFYALGTIAWPQSKHPFDHPVEMLFMLLAVFYAHIYVKGGRTGYLLLSSASLGYAFITRAPAILALLPIFVYLFYRHLEDDVTKKRISVALKDCAVYSFVFLPFVLIQLLYNYVRFGSLFETGITLMAQKAGIDFFTGTPFFTGMSGFLISPGKGFFYYSPITILIFFSIKGFYKRHKGLTFCILGTIFSYLVFLSRNIYWHGDWAWGPRYLLVITPLIMVPIADFVEEKFSGGKKVLRSSVLGLFLVSIAVQIIGVSVDFNRYFISLQADRGIRFTSVGGKDVPHIYEPPPSTHFDWDKSPIVYQAVFGLKIMKGLYDPQEALRFNVFDFWWHYTLYAGSPPYAVLLILSLLGFVIIFSWFRILKMVDK